MDQTSTIHSVDTRFIYDVWSCHFPSNTHYKCFDPLVFAVGRWLPNLFEPLPKSR